MSGQTRALEPSPRVRAVELVAAVLSGRDNAERQAALAMRTATADRGELVALLTSAVSVAAWLVRALASCRRSAPSDVVDELRRLAGGSS